MPQLDSLFYGTTVLWLIIFLWSYYFSWKFKGMRKIIKERYEDGEKKEGIGLYCVDVIHKSGKREQRKRESN